MLWPPDVHEAEDTADSNVGVCQTILNQEVSLALLDPGRQSAKTAFDFAHLTLHCDQRGQHLLTLWLPSNRTDQSKVYSSYPHHAAPRRKPEQEHRKCRPRQLLSA